MSQQSPRPNVLNEARWTEIRFYFFCRSLYDYRKNVLDVTYAVESLCQLGHPDPITMKRLSVNCLSDIAFSPGRSETILLGRQHGKSLSELADIMQTSRRTLCNWVKATKTAYSENSTFPAKLMTKELNAISDFMRIVDHIKGGII